MPLVKLAVANKLASQDMNARLNNLIIEIARTIAIKRPIIDSSLLSGRQNESLLVENGFFSWHQQCSPHSSTRNPVSLH
jgi:hypothetical protein